ncbi:hypothetical protein SCAR479_13369 [Seiridium cardinale]|uniref:Uncharacterized protein n=1 Tax=Seiridium cardinale TaxID=138064 RepID=A0ABR2X867_9PEZI
MSEEVEWRETYVEFIRSCYHNHPESFSYYGRLIDHLKQGSDRTQTRLQEVRLFEVSTLAAASSYPCLFPFQRTTDDHVQEKPRIAVLEGFPSPTCIASLGSKWHIRPEYFLGHLPTTGGALYELPTLPSLQDNLICIQYASVVRPFTDRKPTNSLASRRSDLAKACAQQEKLLSSDKRYGTTRFRKVNQHDSQISSVEQTVSLTVIGEADKWTAIYITDQGSQPIHAHGMPWEIGSNGRPSGTLPLVPFNAPSPTPNHTLTSVGEPASLDQFHPLKNVGVKDQVDHQFLIDDPFFLLCGSLRTSLMSWTQLLNFVTESIEDSNTQLELEQGELRYHLDQLRFNMGLIHGIKEYLAECLQLIKHGGCPSWPKTMGADTVRRKQLVQGGLEDDYSHAVERCSLLIGKCQSAIDVLVGFAQLVASERGISQAKEVQSLTKLASVFIPLSFATSLFGMNIKEWQPGVSLNWFIGMAVLFSVISVLLVYRRWCQQKFSALRGYWRY